MAKKKVSQSHHGEEKPSKKQEDVVKAHKEVTPAMDADASEKLETLKALNQLLLKEAHERRQQVDSLVQSKGSLEMELVRSNLESELLKSELTQLGESAARLELERSVVASFVAAQVGLKGEVTEGKMKGLEMEMWKLKRVVDERESEIERLIGMLSEIQIALGNEREYSLRVCVERDEFKDKLDREIEECEGLRANLIEFEGRQRAMEQETGELQIAYNAVVREKEERNVMIESITREKDSIERSLVESDKLIEEMKEELHGVVREKEKIEQEKNVEMVKRKKLENAMNGLNEVVVSLQKEEEKLQANVFEFEKKCVEGEEREKEMKREIDQLVGQRKLNEKRIDELVDEKTAIEKDLSEALKQLADQKHKIEEMVNEKIVMVEAKSRLDSEVVALQKQVAELKAALLKLEESNRVEAEKIESLESEVGDYKFKLEQAKVEKNEMEKCLEEEKQSAERLKEKIGELENKIKAKIVESLKAAEEAKTKNAAIYTEKIVLERDCLKLREKVTSLEKTIIETQNEYASMKRKVELAETNSELVVNMLKETAAFCSKDEKDVSIGDKETKPYVIEMEMIKKAFKSKETKVEDMKRQLESLQNSKEDAEKKKSFWTMLSSATTLLAAVSLAYMARGN